MTRAIIHLTIETPDLAPWLAAAEPLHRMLRPQMAAGYDAIIRRILAEGAELALVHQAGSVRALALFRAFHNTWNGYRFYIDDLVTDESHRSAGHGAYLLHWCEDLARSKGCTGFTLESGVQRDRAHRFYFREGMSIAAFGFSKSIARG
ncbi:MAG: GNAT family N-acetyltransferase [Acidiphilium sp.]|nr:GNAT family N-acetyltransferase [Acidiphilium sp.]MDD4934666.1 GNAT family N-acetyltransferase [Acidiphilium sp.]